MITALITAAVTSENNSLDYFVWVIFSLFVIVALALDLGLLNQVVYIFKNKYKNGRPSNKDVDRYKNIEFDSDFGSLSNHTSNPKSISNAEDSDSTSFAIKEQKASVFRHALIWTVIWISLACVFAGIIYIVYGHNNALLFLTGYAIEKSLSMDNLFVFLIIFSSLAIPYIYQHKVLMAGIISAIVMRIGLILGGISLLESFHWMIYVFGALLLFTAIRMLVEKKEKKIEIEKNIAVRILKRFIPISLELHGNQFLIKKKITSSTNLYKYVVYATPMLVALIIIEVTDLVFALDSIPAILAITTNTFIVITSNLFAILGLRSLYFLLAEMMEKFYYLKPGLAAILVFVGIKIIISEYYKLPIVISISVIFGILAFVFILSMIRGKRIERESL
jgi:tellurite resistance protein TerC